MQRWTSDPLPLPQHDLPFAEAILGFEDIRHDGDSFSVFAYLDNPDVDPEAGVGGDGFAGQFRVFAHGECWGGIGHCDLPKGPIHAFDTRPAHPLTPIDIAVDCTAALRQIKAPEVTVTALAYSFGAAETGDLLRFKRLRLITYD